MREFFIEIIIPVLIIVDCVPTRLKKNDLATRTKIQGKIDFVGTLVQKLSGKQCVKQFLVSAVNLRANCTRFSPFNGPNSNTGLRFGNEGQCMKRKISEQVTLFILHRLFNSVLKRPKSTNATNRPPVFHGFCFFHTLSFSLQLSLRGRPILLITKTDCNIKKNFKEIMYSWAGKANEMQCL